MILSPYIQMTSVQVANSSPEHLSIGQYRRSAPQPVSGAQSDNLDEVMGGHIRRVFAEAGGKVSEPKGAATRLGVNPGTLKNRLKKLGVSYGMKSVKAKISVDVKN